MNLAALSIHVWIVPVVAVALTQIAVIATSVYLHRTLAHRALAVHPVAELVFRTVLWLTTGQRRQQWVAVHRKHHTYTDREGDPHSPRLLGFWRTQLLNVAYYMREARNQETIRKFAPDIIQDRLAWMTGGESLHNNHHAPRAPKFSVRRSEFDPSWLVVRVMAAIRLVVIVGSPVRLSAGGTAR